MGSDVIRPIAEFSRPDAASLWQVVNDDVMGGRSVSRVQASPRGSILFSGEVSLANRGGFASMRTIPRALGLRPNDVLLAKVRGDGRSYLLNLYTRGAPIGFSHRAPFETLSGEWLEVRVPLGRFVATSFGAPVARAAPVQPGDVDSVGIMVCDGRAGPFSLELAALEAEA
jgi:monofunctional biosynthetic peptidoglycan transglycosylase